MMVAQTAPWLTTSTPSRHGVDNQRQGLTDRPTNRPIGPAWPTWPTSETLEPTSANSPAALSSASAHKKIDAPSLETLKILQGSLACRALSLKPRTARHAPALLYRCAALIQCPCRATEKRLGSIQNLNAIYLIASYQCTSWAYKLFQSKKQVLSRFEARTHHPSRVVPPAPCPSQCLPGAAAPRHF